VINSHIGRLRQNYRLWALALFCSLFGIASPGWAQSSPPGKIAAVNGITMHYQEHGQGEPLLLLHGFGGCGADWAPFAEVLAQDYRVISVDLRGHGWSTNPANAFTMRQSGEDIAALLDKLGIEKTRAIGISAGGMTLLHLAIRHPEQIEAMVLIGASTHFPKETRAITAGSRWESLPPPVQQFFRACAKRGGDQVERLLTQFRGFSTSYEDMTFTPPTLGTIKARTLIVHGDRDEFFPVEIPVTMYDAIPGSELWIVPGGDHVPIYDDRMPEFLRVARKFLARTQPDGK
jgi:pimeloyl-ACP methyl ester carboxylesterase